METFHYTVGYALQLEVPENCQQMVLTDGNVLHAMTPDNRLPHSEILVSGFPILFLLFSDADVGIINKGTFKCLGFHLEKSAAWIYSDNSGSPSLSHPSSHAWWSRRGHFRLSFMSMAMTSLSNSLTQAVQRKPSEEVSSCTSNGGNGGSATPTLRHKQRKRKKNHQYVSREMEILKSHLRRHCQIQMTRVEMYDCFIKNGHNHDVRGLDLHTSCVHSPLPRFLH